MEIRKAEAGELAEIQAVFARARRFMRESGNMRQWAGGYPPDAVLLADIARGNLHVCVEDGAIEAVFAFIPGPDPTYSIIRGRWPDHLPYHVIHRVASAGRRPGMTRVIFDWAFERTEVLRIDTHRDNLPMQKKLRDYGFRQCGVIWLADGAERIAYQKNR